MLEHLSSITKFAHFIVAGMVEPGDTVVDATCGNGHDTLFLAELVGKTGKVIGFDIQPIAIDSTHKQLKTKGYENWVSLYQESHANIDAHVQEPIKVCMFNLGYLPNSDRDIITESESTISAMRHVMELVMPGGLISIVAYKSHPGGLSEFQALQAFLNSLEEKQFKVSQYEMVNSKALSPSAFFIWKNRTRAKT